MQELYLEDAYLQSGEAKIIHFDEKEAIITDRTIFYPTGGGQPGDSGQIVLPDGKTITITNTIREPQTRQISHLGAELASKYCPIGATIQMQIDWKRRFTHMRMHSALHLLSTILPYPVTGGAIGAEKSRLDFDMPDFPMTKEEITTKLNSLIHGNHAITAEWISAEEMARRPDLTKTVAVKPPATGGKVRLIRIEFHDLQACGGTHVRHSGEIGAVTITKLEKKGRHNRRVVMVLNP